MEKRAYYKRPISARQSRRKKPKMCFVLFPRRAGFLGMSVQHFVHVFDRLIAQAHYEIMFNAQSGSHTEAEQVRGGAQNVSVSQQKSRNSSPCFFCKIFVSPKKIAHTCTMSQQTPIEPLTSFVFTAVVLFAWNFGLKVRTSHNMCTTHYLAKPKNNITVR